jgi:CelD/BcsL family acetyltransferase involved in cellulose biosynthesis
MNENVQRETIATSALNATDRAAWLRLRTNNPELESPYHHPDYHRLVDIHQGGGRLTLARRDGELTAVLPWQGGRFARPSGAPMSDYQAVIGEPLPVDTLLTGQAVGAFHYTAMPHPDGEQTARIEIDDPEAWRAAQSSSYRRHLKSTRRRIRKAEEEVGPRRVVTQSRNIDEYQALMSWKRGKFAETGKYDVLANPGTSGLLRALWESGPEAELRCDLHSLYFGDRLAACDLGLTDGKVFHSWIVGYDPDLLPYAPGIQLLEGVIDAVPTLGYRVIDLGPGLDGYKRHYASHARTVSDGLVTLFGPAGAMAGLYDWLETGLRGGTNDALGKIRRRYSQIAACEPRLSRRGQALAKAVTHHFRQSPA